MLHDGTVYAVDNATIASNVRRSRVRRGLALGGDVYQTPSLTAPWVTGSGRSFSINGTQISETNITFTGILATNQKWLIEFDVSGYTAGNLTVKNTASSLVAISANGSYSLEFENLSDIDLLFSADAGLVATVDIISIKRIR